MSENTAIPEITGLGKQISEYAGQGLGGKIGYVVAGLIAIGIMLGSVGWGVSMAWDMLHDSNPSYVLLVVMLIFALVGGFTGLVFAALSFKIVYESIGLRIALYENGLVHYWRNQQTIVPWDTIQNVWFQPYSMGNRSASANQVAYQLEHGSKQFIRIDQAHMPNAEYIGQRVMREAEQRLLPQFIQKIDKGEHIAFGIANIHHFSVHQRGIAHKEKLLLWEEVAGVVRHMGSVPEIRIMQRGEPGKKDKVWQKFFLPQVSNPGALDGIVRHFSKK
jgi:hypothetical protein